jgi:hypothetical protein
MAELEKAWAQIEILSSSLELAHKQLNDAAAGWEQQQRAEREWWIQAIVSIKEECLNLEGAARAERAERAGDLKQTRMLAARLEATTDELLRRGKELTVTHRTVSQVRSGEQQLGRALQWAEAQRYQQAAERTELVKEMANLEHRYEAVKLAAKDSVPSAEVERTLLLVATLWHAAARQAPPDNTPESRAQRADEVLHAWRAYFCRDSQMEAPFLRPTTTLILEPLRLTAGPRIAEVMLHQQPIPDAVQLSVLAAQLAPPRLRMPGGPPRPL